MTRRDKAFEELDNQATSATRWLDYYDAPSNAGFYTESARRVERNTLANVAALRGVLERHHEDEDDTGYCARCQMPSPCPDETAVLDALVPE